MFERGIGVAALKEGGVGKASTQRRALACAAFCMELLRWSSGSATCCRSQYKTEPGLLFLKTYWTSPSWVTFCTISREAKILMVGLDGAGKTRPRSSSWLAIGENVLGIPIIGFNVETFSYNNIHFTCGSARTGSARCGTTSRAPTASLSTLIADHDRVEAP
jgi:hypothetical protein